MLYVYKQIEDDKLVYPQKCQNLLHSYNPIRVVIEEETRKKATRTPYTNDIDHDKDNDYKYVAPFDTCSNAELQTLFVHNQVQLDDSLNFQRNHILNTTYTVRTPIGVSDMESDIDPGWSIITTNPTYTKPLRATNFLFEQTTESSNDSISPACVNTPYPTDVLSEERYFMKHDDVVPLVRSTEFYNGKFDIGATYLGTANPSRGEKFLLEGIFTVGHNCYTRANLLNGQSVTTLFDTGATMTTMTKAFYDACPILHKAPKYKPHMNNCVIGDGKPLKFLFTIPVVINFQGHLFEFHSLVNECTKYYLFTISVKDLYELEATLDLNNNKLHFMNRSALIFPQRDYTVPPFSKTTIDIHVLYPLMVSGKGVVKILLWQNAPITHLVDVHRNSTKLVFNNRTDKPWFLPSNTALGILDVRSMGYYYIPRERLQAELSQTYNLMSWEDFSTSANLLCAQVLENYSVKRKSPSGDPYPWLAVDDKRRTMTDEEILREKVDLSKSALSDEERENLMSMIISYKDAFSLRDEIGSCPNLKVNIDIVDDSPFFVRPFPISEPDKKIMDKEMNRLVELGILSKNCTSHTSPVMLITRKLTKDKRPIVDFRLLNTRIRRRNNAVPLLTDIFKILGHSECDVMSCVDIKDAYHSIKLGHRSKEYCGILPYFGSQHYRYEVLPMGLGSSPAIWMTYVNFLLDSMKQRNNIIAIMDDLLLHSKREHHFKLLKSLFEAMIENGLKLSPKKSQLFMTELVYLGTLFNIKQGKMLIKPLRTRIDAIQNIPVPKTPKACKSFCGMVNYVALFCQDLQSLLSPIYDLTRKGVKFVWTDKHEQHFKEIKKRLCDHPVLHLPIPNGRFILYSDTSRRHAGSALWQIQQCTPKLIGYASKTLPKACANYGVTELEMYGLLINLHSWKHYLANIDFDAATDHLAAVHIMNGKRELKGRLKDIVPKIFEYTFKLYYVKGKDLILADYFSRIAADKSNPNECMPISFINHMTTPTENYHIMTRGQASVQGITAPKVHGADKVLNPNVKPEHQARSTRNAVTRRDAPKPTGSSGRIISRKLLERSKNVLRNKATPPNKSLPGTDSTVRPAYQRPAPPPCTPIGRDVAVKQPDVKRLEEATPQPSYVPPIGGLKLAEPFVPKITKYEDIEAKYDPLMDVDSPFDEALIEIEYRKPEAKDFDLPPLLADEIKSQTILAKAFPKQSDIDQIRKQIDRKVLRQTHLPMSIRDLQAAYLKAHTLRTYISIYGMAKVLRTGKILNALMLWLLCMSYSTHYCSS